MTRIFEFKVIKIKERGSRYVGCDDSIEELYMELNRDGQDGWQCKTMIVNEVGFIVIMQREYISPKKEEEYTDLSRTEHDR